MQMLAVCTTFLICEPSHLLTHFIRQQSTSVRWVRRRNPHPRICPCTCYLWHSLSDFCLILGSISNTSLLFVTPVVIKTVTIIMCKKYIALHSIYLHICSTSSFNIQYSSDITLVRNVNFNCTVRSGTLSAYRDEKKVRRMTAVPN